MNIRIETVKKNEYFSAFVMQKSGYINTFLKYFDSISPVFNSYHRFSSAIKKDNHILYWIICNDLKIGEIELAFKGDMIHITNFFILKKYQNKGIGQTVITHLHTKYNQCRQWHLFTIKQEERNLHLYEKLGYVPTGAEKKINKRMIIIDYEKRLD